MPRGRFLSKSISLDEKVNSLSNDTARLLFTWLLSHLDCEGRLHGDAITVKSIVFSRRNISVTKVEQYLNEMEKLGLVLRYSVNENQYLSAPNFEKHQIGLQKDKEAQSLIPPPTPELRQSNARKSPPQAKGKVKYKEEVKVEDNKNIYGEFKNVFLTDSEYNKLKERFNNNLPGMIENLSAGIESKGYKYKSHYATILNWSRRTGENTKKDPTDLSDKFNKQPFDHLIRR